MQRQCIKGYNMPRLLQLVHVSCTQLPNKPTLDCDCTGGVQHLHCQPHSSTLSTATCPWHNRHGSQHVSHRKAAADHAFHNSCPQPKKHNQPIPATQTMLCSLTCSLALLNRAHLSTASDLVNEL